MFGSSGALRRPPAIKRGRRWRIPRTGCGASEHGGEWQILARTAAGAVPDTVLANYVIDPCCRRHAHRGVFAVMLRPDAATLNARWRKCVLRAHDEFVTRARLGGKSAGGVGGAVEQISVRQARSRTARWGQQSSEGGLGEKDSETTRNPQAGAGVLPHCELREAVAEAVSPLPLLPRVRPIEAIRSAWLLEAEI